MNLHGIVRGVITAVNPDRKAILRLSSGYSIAADGTQVPAYDPDVPVQAQMQDLSQKDIQHLEALNVQGSQKVIYLYGELQGLSRPGKLGGDLVVMEDGTWLVTAVMEQWPDWCKVSVTMQNGG